VVIAALKHYSTKNHLEEFKAMKTLTRGDRSKGLGCTFVSTSRPSTTNTTISTNADLESLALNFTVVSPNQRTVKSLTPFSATASPLFDQSMDIPEDEEVVSPLPTIPKAHQTTCGLSRYLRRQELLIRLGDPFIQDHRGKTGKGGGRREMAHYYYHHSYRHLQAGEWR